MTALLLRFCPLTLLLASCSAIAPQSVTQLDTMKANATKGDLQANANATVSCVASDQGCYQIHLLKGDACYALSRQAQGAARRTDDTCAATELGAGVAQAPGEQTPAGTTHDYAVKRLEVLHDLIDTRRAGDPSGADTLAAAAQDFLQRYSNDPAGINYLASARMTTAQDQFVATRNKPALCAALPGIASLTSQGANAPGSFGPNFAELAATIAGMRKAGGCS